MYTSYLKKIEAIVQQACINYLVHPSTHILVRLTHGDLSTERANCKFHKDFFLIQHKHSYISHQNISFTFSETDVILKYH